MKLVELESKKEQLAFLKILTEHPSIFNSTSYYMGGIRDKGKWFWESFMKHISFPLIWHLGAPDNNTGNEFCLIVQKRKDVVGVKFDDIDCKVNIRIICEKSFLYNI